MFFPRPATILKVSVDKENSSEKQKSFLNGCLFNDRISDRHGLYRDLTTGIASPCRDDLTTTGVAMTEGGCMYVMTNNDVDYLRTLLIKWVLVVTDDPLAVGEFLL